MKRVYTFNLGESAEAGLIKNLMGKDGISCLIRNEYRAMASGSLPFTECYPELWILNDDDNPKAKELLDIWLESRNRVNESWVCRECGEQIEGQFMSCWKCGNTRENDPCPQ